MWYVYILECANKSLYTGITNDLPHRLEMHRCGKGSKYVRAHLPVELVYQEELPTRNEALSREAQIKALSRTEKLLLLTPPKP